MIAFKIILWVSGVYAAGLLLLAFIFVSIGLDPIDAAFRWLQGQNGR